MNFNKIEMQNNNGIFTATIKLTAETGYYFCLYNPRTYYSIGPGKVTDLSSIPLNESSTYSTVELGSRGNCWVGAPPVEDGDVSYAISFDYNTSQATITNLGEVKEEVKEIYNITVNVKADNFTFGRHISNYLHILNPETMKAVDVNSTKLSLDYTEDAPGFSFASTEGYEMTLECTNYEGDPLQAPFTIMGISPMADDEVLEFGKQYILWLSPAAQGLNFEVVIKRVPQQLPEKLYVMIGQSGITLNSQLKPGPNDPYLTLNPETQVYEGNVTMGKRRFKFYKTLEDDQYMVLGQNGGVGSDYINFNRQLAPFKSDCAWEADNCWYMAYTFNNNDSQEVHFQVDAIEGVMIATPVLPPAPNVLYLFGSDQGGFPETFYLKATMTKQPGTNTYTVSVDVPKVEPGTWSDPDTGATYDYEGWSFMIGYNRDILNTGLFRVEDNSKFIDFEKSWKYSAPATGDNPLNTLYVGPMDITFNWDTLELTAVNPNADTGYEVTFDFIFNDEPLLTAELPRYIMAYDNSAEEALAINANPYPYYFNSSEAILTFGAQKGYLLEIECTDYDGDEEGAPFQIYAVSPMDDLFASQWNMRLLSGANGLNFKVTVGVDENYEPEEPDGPDTPDDPDSEVDGIASDSAPAAFYTLQGVRVENPESGLYIRVANGKATKVLIRK